MRMMKKQAGRPKIQAIDRSRAIYNALPKQQGVISTESYLRLESAALGTQSQIDFKTLVNEGTPNETEQRLSLTDTFTVTAMGIFLIKAATAGQTRSSELHTFPNATVFSGSGEAVNLMNIYNGYFSAKVNGVQYIPRLDVYRFFRAGQAQKNVGLSTYDATNNANNKYLTSGWPSENYGYKSVTPTFELSGARKNELAITCPASIAMAGTSSSNYVVMILRGFLNQNAANFR